MLSTVYAASSISCDSNGFDSLLSSHNRGKWAVLLSSRFQKAPASADLIDAKGDN